MCAAEIQSSVWPLCHARQQLFAGTVPEPCERLRGSSRCKRLDESPWQAVNRIEGALGRLRHHGQVVQVHREGRVELISRYALSKEKRRIVEEYAGIAEADLTPNQKIELIKHAGVRAMIHELNNPEKRLQLIILAWYCTMRRR
jgi:hypothetical protein|eukprot:5269952-Prymnesium_polylepis.1